MSDVSEKPVELKPCPFCGGEAKLVETDGYCQMGAHAVVCLRCGAEQERDDIPAAIAAWNTRPADDARDRIRLPTSAEEARAMIRVGKMYLLTNYAPDETPPMQKEPGRE